jgi:DHA3 family macrolide efflux protein-like MFS transporter
MVFQVSAALLFFCYLILYFNSILVTVYVVAFISSILSSVNSDSFNALLKELVDDKKLPKAISLSHGTNALSELTGIMTGGAFIYQGNASLIAALLSLPAAAGMSSAIKSMERSHTLDRFGYS